MTSELTPGERPILVVSYQREDEGPEALQAYAVLAANVDVENLKKLANHLAHGARATLGTARIALTRDDWNEVKFLPIATAVAPQGVWQPIATAPSNECLWLFAESLKHPEYNPTGVVDGHWQDDLGWQGAVWDGYHDEWKTKVVQPTHWMRPYSPASQVEAQAPAGEGPLAAEIERLAVEHEAFGFGMVDAKGFTTHGFDAEGLAAFVSAVQKLGASASTAPTPLDATEFEQFSKLVAPGVDISRFKDLFMHSLDINGAIPAHLLGFHFSLNDDDEPGTELTAEAVDLLDTFAPLVIYAGTPEMQEQLKAMGRNSMLVPWYEGSGFAAVLQIPCFADLSLRDRGQSGYGSRPTDASAASPDQE